MKQDNSRSGPCNTGANLPSAGQYEIDVRGYLDTLVEGKFRILLICLLTIAVAVVYLVFAAPIYSSNVLLQFMDKENASGALGEISNALVTKTSTATAEVEIIKSRRILEATIDQLNLDIIVKPKQRLDNGEIVVDWLQVAPQYIGKKLTLKSTENGKYQLFGPDGSLWLSGLAGEPREGQSPGTTGILISKLDVEAGAELYLSKKTLQASLTELLNRLVIKEEGKSSGIFSLTHEGENPRLIANTLNTIVDNYLVFSATKKSEEIQHMIEFVQKETLATRQRLERAEAAQVDYLFSHNSTGLSSEVTKLVDRLASIESQISDLEIQKVGSESKYTQNHPRILDLKRKIELLQSEKSDIDQRLKLLPEEEREREALMRDVEAARQLYIHLQSKEQELGVALSGVASGVQVIDFAQVPSVPVKPKKWLVLALSVMAGLFLSLFYVIGRRGLSSGIEDPDVIENELGIPVSAVVVFSRLQSVLERNGKGRPGKRQENVLAVRNPSDPAVEGLRGLGTTIRLSGQDGINNVISISSPAPDTGVSFIAENLGQLLADSGLSVLLVDGNLRWGKMDKTFGVKQSPGLTDYLQGGVEIKDLVHQIGKTGSGALDFVARGSSVNNSAELLMNEGFGNFVQACSQSYGMVIFLTPPVTAVTDGVIISKYAGRNFLVVRHGRQSKAEIVAAEKNYRNAGITNTGIIFNGMLARPRDRYRYSYQPNS